MKALKHKSSFLKQKKNIFCRGATFIDMICNKKTLHALSIAASLSVIEHHAAYAMDSEELIKGTVKSTPSNINHLEFKLSS